MPWTALYDFCVYVSGVYIRRVVICVLRLCDGKGMLMFDVVLYIIVYYS